MVEYCTFSPAIFRACHLVQPSDRGECEFLDTIDLLIQLGQTIDTFRMDGREVDTGCPDDRDCAKAHWKSKPADT